MSPTFVGTTSHLDGAHIAIDLPRLHSYLKGQQRVGLFYPP